MVGHQIGFRCERSFTHWILLILSQAIVFYILGDDASIGMIVE
jgi:hypothetical protein